MSISVLSVFSGCGGFDTGFRRAGYFVESAFDINAAAIASYNHNVGREIAVQADLFQTSPERVVELVEQRIGPAGIKGVIGGPPCQPFSSGNVSPKVDESKHELPRNYAAILRHLNHRFDLDFFVFENVRGITQSKHKHNFGRFKQEFEAAGFKLFEGLLDAVEFGVPQVRPRVFVVGLNRARFGDLTFGFPRGKVEKKRTVRETIEGLVEPAFFRRGLTRAEIPYHANHWTMTPRSPKFKTGFLTEGTAKGRSFRVLSWDRPSWTVAYGHREIHVHPSGRRRLSVYEAMRLQGFPHSYELIGNLSQQVRQVSDAIPPAMGEVLGHTIARTLEKVAGW